jgi:hypothetical protein
MQWRLNIIVITATTGAKKEEAGRALSFGWNRRNQMLRALVRISLSILVIGLCVSQPAHARIHRLAPAAAAGAATPKPDAQIPVKMKRDPADMALDRKSKGICKGC